MRADTESRKRKSVGGGDDECHSQNGDINNSAKKVSKNL